VINGFPAHRVAVMLLTRFGAAKVAVDASRQSHAANPIVLPRRFDTTKHSFPAIDARLRQDTRHPQRPQRINGS
jgi:hypothetical protein